MFDVNTILNDMAEAVQKTAAGEAGKINGYAERIMANEKTALEELAQARRFEEISDEEFLDEVEREKQVVQAELLTLQIMSKAMAQKAVNAAMDIFVNAVKLAL